MPPPPPPEDSRVDRPWKKSDGQVGGGGGGSSSREREREREPSRGERYPSHDSGRGHDSRDGRGAARHGSGRALRDVPGSHTADARPRRGREGTGSRGNREQARSAALQEAMDMASGMSGPGGGQPQWSETSGARVRGIRGSRGEADSATRAPPSCMRCFVQRSSGLTGNRPSRELGEPRGPVHAA